MSGGAPDTSRVIGVDYEAVNHMAVSSREDANYARKLAEKAKDADVTKPSNAQVVKAIGKAMKAAKNAPADTGPKRKASGMMQCDGLDDLSSEEAPPKKAQRTEKKAPHPRDPEKDKRTVVLTQLPPDTQDADITALLQLLPDGTCDVATVDISIQRRGSKCRGMAFVTLPTAEVAQAVVGHAAGHASGFAVRGKEAKAAMKGAAAPAATAAPQEKHWMEGAKQDGRTAFLKGNFHGASAADDIVASLSVCGEVVHCGVVQSRRGAIVQFAAPEALQKALELKGVILNSTEVVITESHVGYDDWAAKKTHHGPKSSTSWKRGGAAGGGAAKAPGGGAGGVAKAQQQLAQPAPAAAAAKGAEEGGAKAPVAAEAVAEAAPAAAPAKPAAKKSAFAFKPRAVRRNAQ